MKPIPKNISLLVSVMCFLPAYSQNTESIEQLSESQPYRLTAQADHENEKVKKPIQTISGTDPGSGQKFTIRVYNEEDCD